MTTSLVNETKSLWKWIRRVKKLLLSCKFSASAKNNAVERIAGVLVEGDEEVVPFLKTAGSHLSLPSQSSASACAIFYDDSSSFTTHTREKLDVTQELSYEYDEEQSVCSNLSITFNGLFQTELLSLEDTLQKFKNIDDSASSQDSVGFEISLPDAAMPQSPLNMPQSPNLSPIKEPFHQSEASSSILDDSFEELETVARELRIQSGEIKEEYSDLKDECSELLEQYSGYSNEYSLAQQVKILLQEKENLLNQQEEDHELHQNNYKKFAEKIQALENLSERQRMHRTELIEKLAQQTMLHRASVQQLTDLSKYNTHANLDAVNDAIQQEGDYILEQFLLDDRERETLEERLEISLAERANLVQKFGKEMGKSKIKYDTLETKYNRLKRAQSRQIQHNATLEEKLYQLQQQYSSLLVEKQIWEDDDTDTMEA
jgi:hypothetical protein